MTDKPTRRIKELWTEYLIRRLHYEGYTQINYFVDSEPSLDEPYQMGTLEQVLESGQVCITLYRKIQLRAVLCAETYTELQSWDPEAFTEGVYIERKGGEEANQQCTRITFHIDDTAEIDNFMGDEALLKKYGESTVCPAQEVVNDLLQYIKKHITPEDADN